MIAVLLVGGEGTRLRPLTEWLPKPMLPIANRPFLEHQIGHLRGHGDDAGGAVVRLPGRSRSATTSATSLEYAVEPEPLGTGGAIRLRGRGIDETFVVCNGDVLTDLDLRALIAAHRGRGGAGDDRASPGGRIPAPTGWCARAQDGVVTAFVEKPPPGAADVDTINAGTYVFEPDVLELIAPGGRCRSSARCSRGWSAPGCIACVDDGGVARHRHAGELPGGEHGGDAGGRAGRSVGGGRAGADVTESVIGADAGIEAGASIQRSRRAARGERRAGAVVPRPGGRHGRGGGVVDDGGMRAAIEGMAEQLLEGDRIGAEAGGDARHADGGGDRGHGRLGDER